MNYMWARTDHKKGAKVVVALDLGPVLWCEMQLAPGVVYNGCLPFGEGRKGRIVLASKALSRLKKYFPSWLGWNPSRTEKQI